MLIPAFWCGVVATILAEIAAIIIASIAFYARSKKKKKPTELKQRLRNKRYTLLKKFYKYGIIILR